jgi:2-polyprenyl-3-methyl-5-hydroxy-6-metoxy-1,4-benzoquinol methylase
MMGTLHSPGCNGREEVRHRAPDLNRRIGSTVFEYLHCGTCGLHRLARIPDDLGAHYPGSYHDLPALGRLEAIAAADSFKIDLVRRFRPTGRLLEVGPGQGTFARQARQAGFDVEVIEMDARCCEHMERVVGVRAIRADVPQDVVPTLGSHDVIALWHVIEHVQDPWGLLRSAATNLAPGGILVIASPNPEAWQFRVMGALWPHLDAPRHLYLIPPGLLQRLGAESGLELVHFTTADSDARHWNRFGWQRLLMNSVPGKWPGRAALVAGTALSVLAAPFERRDPAGSAYTLVLQRPAP